MITSVEHRPTAELAAGLAKVLRSPHDAGRLDLVVRRPAPEQREVLDDGVLDARVGLVGDNWLARGSRQTPDGAAIPAMQVTVMNSRVAELVAGSRDDMRWAGDQLYVDFDITIDNLPAGTLIAIGSAVLEVSAAPHLGCAKFVERFGKDAMRWVNSSQGRKLRLRGVNTRVVTPGRVRVGDVVRALTADELAGTRLRAMRHDDLPMFAGWLEQPHVQRWWPAPLGDEAIADYAAAIDGTDPTDVFVIEHDRRPVGMIQRFRIDDYPEYVKVLAAAVDFGVAASVDYLVGEPDLCGRGIGTQAISLLTAMTLEWWPDVTAMLVSVQQANRPSWRALEKAGYVRVWEGQLDTDDPSDAGPAYIYRYDRQ